MGWKSDWLYQIIFQQAQQLWHQTHTSREEPVPQITPPDYFLISEYASFRVVPYQDSPRLRDAKLGDEPVRYWSYNDEGLRRIAAPESPADLRESRGMYHKVGRIIFSIHTDRKLVFLGYGMGPRFARSGVYEVHGQGKTGSLSPAADFIFGVS